MLEDFDERVVCPEERKVSVCTLFFFLSCKFVLKLQDFSSSLLSEFGFLRLTVSELSKLQEKKKQTKEFRVAKNKMVGYFSESCFLIFFLTPHRQLNTISH